MSYRNIFCLTVLAILALYVSLCSAGKENIKIDHLKPRAYTGDRFAFFLRSKPAVQKNPVTPYFALNLTIRRNDGQMEGAAQYVRYHWKYADKINFRRRDPDSCVYFDDGFIPPGSSSRFHLQTLNFTDSLTFSISEQFDITEDDGPYYWLLVNCMFGQKGSDRTLRLTGHTEFHNTNGWLSGDDFYYEPFYVFFFILWFCCAALWTFYLVVFRKEVHIIQRGITALFWSACLDSMMWMIVFVMYNRNGKSPVVAEMFAALTTAWRNTAARLLLLVICIGYKVISRDLGTRTSRLFIAILTPVYFFLTLIYNWMSTVDAETSSNVPGGILGLFLGLIFVCDVLWYVAIVYCLVWTSRILKNPRANPQKRFAYTVFLWAMILCGIVAIIFSILALVGTIGTLYDKWWRVSWFLNDGFWELLFFVLMSVLSFMWRPSLANEHNFREENLAPVGGAPGVADAGAEMTAYSNSGGSAPAVSPANADPNA